MPFFSYSKTNDKLYLICPLFLLIKISSTFTSFTFLKELDSCSPHQQVLTRPWLPHCSLPGGSCCPCCSSSLGYVPPPLRPLAVRVRCCRPLRDEVLSSHLPLPLLYIPLSFEYRPVSLRSGRSVSATLVTQILCAPWMDTVQDDLASSFTLLPSLEFMVFCASAVASVELNLWPVCHSQPEVHHLFHWEKL